MGKVCLLAIDKRFLHGKIKKRLHRVEMDAGHEFLKNGEPYYIEDLNTSVKRSKLLRVPLRDLITMQTYFPQRFREPCRCSRAELRPSSPRNCKKD